MKKALIAASLIVAAAFISGCSAPYTFGGLYGDTTLGLTATSNNVGSKEGRATVKNIVGVSIGDASIQTAAKNGGIKKISTVDVHGKCILGVYSETTIIVTGE